MGRENAPPGVTPLDHTADVGMEVVASTLSALFTRAALGTLWLMEGDEPEARPVLPGSRFVALSSSDLPTLLRAWLRELVHWRESEALSFVEASFRSLTENGLEAEVVAVPTEREPIREIKGVTLHGLVVERRGEGWFGRVIFDV